jgi:hypothetical protein
MTWRNVAEADVIKTLEAPDRTEASVGKRINAYKTLDNRMLKVTYSVDNSQIVVVTVIRKT